MNTTSLLLTGRPFAALTILPSPSATSSRPSSPTTAKSTTQPHTSARPSPPRRTSSTSSTGWYLDSDTPSLQDFEQRAQTYAKRFEKFITRCATNMVMGLMSPAAVALVLFNPVLLVLVLLVLIGVVIG